MPKIKSKISSKLYNAVKHSVEKIISSASAVVLSPVEDMPETESLSESCEFFASSSSCDSSQFHDVCAASFNLRNDLVQWANDNVTHSAVSNLLKILKKYPCGSDLPLDARTLFKTPRQIIVKNLSNGVYYHFGIEDGIKNLLNINPIDSDSINLLINIDGLPLTKSSGSQLWPILGSLSYNLSTPAAFPIGVFHSNQKPKDSNEFLCDFVSEFKELLSSGLYINGKRLDLILKGMICDAPARAFILNIKSHSGYSSCNKCFETGEYYKRRICFLNTDVVLRTDDHFRNPASNDDHHKSDSVLLEIPSFKPVTDVPLEYMHLVCLGVMRKLLKLWLKDDLKFRLPNLKVNAVSIELENLQDDITSDFCRKPRALKEFERWKASELRQFILYTGPVVLKEHLKQDLYTHFMLFHCAMKVLASSDLCISLADHAQAWLKGFVDGFPFLYGRQHMSHNVHGLIHLTEDVKCFGCLDKFSAFQFENYMRVLKRMVRKADKPLQQIIARMKEKVISENFLETSDSGVQVYKEHHDGSEVNGVQYRQLRYKSFLFKIFHPDNCCMLKNNIFCVMKNIAKKSDGSISIVVEQFIYISDLYDYPCKSSVFHIFYAEKLSSVFEVSVDSIMCKCLALKKLNGFALFPLHRE